ncbi:MAG: methyltransferase domain-containing protein [Granulosicoccus sp.]
MKALDPVKTMTNQQWLDTHQYTTESIEDYERVFGKDFVSPGGSALSEQLIASLALIPGQQVLDVGCGLGGSAFLMARDHQVNVTGIDLSENMLRLARQRLNHYKLQALVSFELQDCLTMTYDTSFDVIHSRDVFLHIAEKSQLFKRLHQALKPDGQLLFTDYGCGPEPWNREFGAYVDSRGYHLHTVDSYHALIEQAGFRSVNVEDLTDQFIELLHAEIDTIQTLDVDDHKKQLLQSSWQSKLQRAQGGDHRWLRASARANAVVA